MGVTEWLLTEGRLLPDGAATFAGLCEHLAGLGIPVSRAWYGGLTLHPLVYAAGCTWRRGVGMQRNRRPHGFETTPMWLASPAIPLLAGGEPIRRHHRQTPDFPIVADLFALGATDYLAFALTVDGRPAVVASFATDAADGFADAELRALLDLRDALSAVLEIQARKELATTLLATYLGAEAGARVLSGAIRRGDGVTMRACIWFSDLRNFTGHSERMPSDEVLTLLGDAFEAQVDAVESVGGTVLKFMGDGLLAIFPAADDDDGAAACEAGVEAARRFRAALPAIDERRGDSLVRCGVALHFGDVVFGNIGGRARLDFTVIGPAVNRAARIEALSSRLGRDVLLSAEVADRCGGALLSLGAHPLKGVPEAIEVFALDNPSPHE